MLTGYVSRVGDDKELYKDVFAAQLTQHEINTLYGRCFPGLSEGDFDQATLEAHVNKDRGIFDTFRPDKRGKVNIAAMDSTYEGHPLAQTLLQQSNKRD